MRLYNFTKTASRDGEARVVTNLYYPIDRIRGKEAASLRNVQGVLLWVERYLFALRL